MEPGLSNVGRRLFSLCNKYAQCATSSSGARVARVSTDAIIQSTNSFKDLAPGSFYLQGKFKKQLLKALVGLMDDEWYLLDAFVGVIELLGIYYNPEEWQAIKVKTNSRLSCPTPSMDLVPAASEGAACKTVTNMRKENSKDELMAKVEVQVEQIAEREACEKRARKRARYWKLQALRSIN